MKDRYKKIIKVYQAFAFKHKINKYNTKISGHY